MPALKYIYFSKRGTVMKHEYLSNVPLEQALEDYIRVLEENGLQPETELIPVQDALNRITYQAVYARISSPHYNSCAMDGIATKAANTFGASETTPVLLLESMYMPVDTGDPLPDGYDCVVMIEDVIQTTKGVKLITSAVPWQHVRQIGEDICAGDMLLPTYTKITPYAIGAMLASGLLEVAVIKKPVIGIIPTGDEIVSARPNPEKGEIVEFNSSIFASMIQDWGCDSITYPIVKDKPELIRNMTRRALAECDIILINAGSSAGRDDYTGTIIKEIGTLLYHGIAIRPGKPTLLGHSKNKPILGIPGYPVSGIIVLTEILRPVIEAILKIPLGNEPTLSTTITKRLNTSLKYKEFVRVQLGYVGGALRAVPLNRGAGVVTSFVKADGIITVPQNLEGLETGDTTDVKILKSKKAIEDTILIIGSHDPLIDEIADILRRQGFPYLVSSSHVGSMGGIMSALRKESHMGGIHLLDPQKGTYNTTYVNKYFKDNQAVLVECVRRKQGLMTTKGNPENIHTIQDLADKGISYVNRQKGSGTRILFDYLLTSNGIETDKIYGYTREEFTHTAVAAQIAENTAQCGMGIYSAAKIYDLDFIPLWDEQYDFLVSKTELENPAVQAVIDILKSVEFKQRLEMLGGYELHQPGKITLANVYQP